MSKTATNRRTGSRVDKGRLRGLLEEMIGIYSPTGREEEIVEFMTGYLQGCGLEVQLQVVEGERCNVLVLPEEGRMELVLVGHLDTVPAFDFEGTEAEAEEGWIRGLGAADMKGGCAAVVEAFTVWAQEQATRRAGLALVVGEEENGDGIDAFLGEHKAGWGLVAEPTDLWACLGHYGYVEIQVSTRGVRRHASCAGPEHNAVQRMLTVLGSLTEQLGREWPEVIYNIRDMSSSEAGFAVPDRCEAWLDLHVPPKFAIGDVVVALEERVEAMEGEAELVFATIHAGYQLPDKGWLAELMRGVYEGRGWRWEPGIFRSESDASHLWAAGVKPMVLGPGQLAQAHTRTESVPFGQVAEAAEVYLDLLEAITKEEQE